MINFLIVSNFRNYLFSFIKLFFTLLRFPDKKIIWAMLLSIWTFDLLNVSCILNKLCTSSFFGNILNF